MAGDTGPAKEKGAQGAGVDFETFVVSLSTSAMLHLGKIPNPDTNKPEPNLPMARQTIDILAMLEAKTAGNLTERERRVLESLLYDLRMKFLEACGAKGKACE